MQSSARYAGVNPLKHLYTVIAIDRHVGGRAASEVRIAPE